jgi:hypothetical protein
MGLLAAWGPGTRGGWDRGLLVGASAGLLFAVAMALVSAEAMAAARSDLSGLTRAQQGEAIRAISRGSAPEDPAVRKAALRRVVHTRRLVERRWRWHTLFLIGWAVIAAGQAIARPRFGWITLVAVVVLLVLHLTSRRRLGRRIDVLAAGDPPEVSGVPESWVKPRAARAPRGRWPSPWIYLLAAPVVALMVTALVQDPGRLGNRSSVAGELTGIVGIATVVTGLLVGVWALSRFQRRTWVLVVQLVVIWAGGLLYGVEVRSDVTYADLAEDAVLLLTTLTQLVPRRPWPPGPPARSEA